jgi:hypothetical protein
MSGSPAKVSVAGSEHAEANRLAWALGISLVLHLLIWGTWYTGQRLGWWEQFPKWTESSRLLSKVLPKPEPPAKFLPTDAPPLVFIDVTESQATTEAPEKADFYSSKNSMAANTEAEQETGIPQIQGTQTQVAKTDPAPRREEFLPLQPARPIEAQPAPEVREEEKARPKPIPGDLELSKPEPELKPNIGQEPRTRPRTIKEALARKQATATPGEAMKQEGGVRRRLDIASLDAVATPFGAYDAALVQAVSQRWYSLLDQRYASDGRGKVVLQFVLHQDGRITDMRVADNSAGEVLGLICQKAVLDPAPFAAWPQEMRRILGEKRNIQFTFYYN